MAINNQRDLRGFLSLNRHLIKIHKVLVVDKPTTNTGNPQNPPVEQKVYVLSDFGENVINSHSSSDGWHSEFVQELFNYVTRNFRNRCTSIQSYNNPLFINGTFNKNTFLQFCSELDADLIMIPYVNAALMYEGNYQDFVLPVGSHFDNNGTDGDPNNSDRHDITPNAETFLINSVAVSARRDTPTEFMGSTSYGYGMEFFEDCSPEGLALDFPDADMPTAFAELLSTDGITFTSTVHPTFTNRLSVGKEITIRYSSDPSTWKTTTITSINAANSISVSPTIDPITTPSIYGWFNGTLGQHVYGQAESWATPIIAGKLKVIKMTTGKDWDTVRAAARATARRNPTGIPEIDNSNWDMYRGFGQINIQAAINYINNQ